MTQFWDEYHIARSPDEVLELLARYDGRGRVVAGGTDLFLDFKDAHWAGERPHYAALIDVTRISGACEIREDDGWVVVGCGVTHTQLVASPLIQARAAALAEACSVVGGPQVRNVATLVGNIAHALPAADGLIALLVLDAQAHVVRPQSSLAQPTWIPIESLYLGPGKSAVDPSREFINAIRFRPTQAGEGSAFTRVMRPQGVALPILGMAARLKTADQPPAHASRSDRTIADAAISAGPVAPVPFRARETEAFLRGKLSGAETLAQAARVLTNEVEPRTSAHRATREYRFELLPVLLQDVVTRAMNRALAGNSRD
ncbi:MAG: FAD binding domain-containing protein [Chloroflexi bacterium]|nr:FAD binding domain-containing protein [Chloroflexota bacterium]